MLYDKRHKHFDPQTQQEILHNGSDMKRFYTLRTEEREDVIARIAQQNSSKKTKK